MNKIFGKKQLVKDISANTLQTVITQVFALLIFYVTSKYLAKDDFGEFNWSMAIGSTIIALASLGLDVVFVKRVASEQDVVTVSGIHFFHTLLVGVVLCTAVLAITMIWPGFRNTHPLFLLVFINLSLINIANSFRLCLVGLESYRNLAIIAFITSVFKFSGILLLYFLEYFTIHTVILTFIISTCIELALGYIFVNSAISKRITPVLKIKEYKYFIMESLPQLGVVFFDSALARMDWILLGIISTASITADYSFAYRMYESSKLPLLVIAPILLTRFSKLFVQPDKIDQKSKDDIAVFFRVELFVVMIIPIILVCSWTPLIDFFTNNKYGAVNELNYMLLAGCVPLHCISNYMWSMGFAQGQLKAIMYITISVAALNFGLNCLLIPSQGSFGASLAFLISTLVQTVLYVIFMKKDHLQIEIKTCFIAFANAIISIAAAKLLTNYAIFTTLLALVISVILALLTNQINLKQLKRIVKINS